MNIQTNSRTLEKREPIDITSLLRPNIRDLMPYSSARHEFEGEARILLDANENPFNSGLNRYPDPLQLELKQRIGEVKGIAPGNIFLGNGSDEAIDLLMRIFCRPGIDHILQLSPTYGMYKVSADISDVEVRDIPLDKNFQPPVEEILAVANDKSKILFLCSPNNPTGSALDRARMRNLITGFPGIVVVDEAYIDFDPGVSATKWLDEFPNLVVLQTFSKAWGMASIRLGMAFAPAPIIAYLNKVKAPYNINQLTQKAAFEALRDPEKMKEQVALICRERARLEKALPAFDCIENVFPSDSNFLLVTSEESADLYKYLVARGIVVRDRSSIFQHIGAMRITVGLPEENEELLAALRSYTS